MLIIKMQPIQSRLFMIHVLQDLKFLKKSFYWFYDHRKKTSSQNELNVTGAYNNGWNFNNKLANHDATVFFPNLCKGEIINLNVSGGGNYWTATGSRFLLFFENRMAPRSYGSLCNTLAIFPVAE